VEETSNGINLWEVPLQDNDGNEITPYWFIKDVFPNAPNLKNLKEEFLSMTSSLTMLSALTKTFLVKDDFEKKVGKAPKLGFGFKNETLSTFILGKLVVSCCDNRIKCETKRKKRTNPVLTNRFNGHLNKPVVFSNWF
jgi:hypothetical protein